AAVVDLEDPEVRPALQSFELVEPPLGEQSCEVLSEAEVGPSEIDPVERPRAVAPSIPGVLGRLSDQHRESGELSLSEEAIAAGSIHVARSESLREPLEWLGHRAVSELLEHTRELIGIQRAWAGVERQSVAELAHAAERDRIESRRSKSGKASSTMCSLVSSISKRRLRSSAVGASSPSVWRISSSAMPCAAMRPVSSSTDSPAELSTIRNATRCSCAPAGGSSWNSPWIVTSGLPEPLRVLTSTALVRTKSCLPPSRPFHAARADWGSILARASSTVSSPKSPMIRFRSIAMRARDRAARHEPSTWTSSSMHERPL